METKGEPELLLTITGGAKFRSGANRVWDKESSDYLGVECERNRYDYSDPSQVAFYINGQSRGAQAVDAQSGDIAKLYDTDGNGRVDAVMITQYHVAQPTGDVTTKGDMVSIPGVTDGFIPAERVNGSYANLRKDDVVLFYTTGQFANETVTLEVPEAVTGQVVSITNKGQARLSGSDKRYGPTGISGGSICSENAMLRWDDFTNEYTFYLDKNGGVCYCVRNTDISSPENPPKPVEPSEPVIGTVPTGLIFRTDPQYGVDGDGNYIINVLDPEIGSRAAMVVDSMSYVNNPYAMYTVDAISDGVVTAMTQVVASDPDKGLTVGTLKIIIADVVTFNEGDKSFQYDSDTVCVLIDLKVTQANGTTFSSAGIFDPDSLDTDPDIYMQPMELYVIADEDDLARYIYVVRMQLEN